MPGLLPAWSRAIRRTRTVVPPHSAGLVRLTLFVAVGSPTACGDAGSGERAALPETPVLSPVDDPLAPPAPGDAPRAQALLHQALENDAAGRADEAARLYEQAYRADPSLVPALLAYGFFLLESAEHLNQGQALLCFRQARLLEPDSAEALCGEGVARHGVGDTQRAEGLLREALLRPEIRESPERLALAQLTLARIEQEHGRPAAADALFREAVAGASGRRKALFLVEHGKFAASQQRFEEAEELMRAAIRSNPLQVTAHYHLFTLLARRGDQEGAATERRIHEVLRQLADHASSFYAGDVERTLRLRRELVEAYPEYPRARLDLVRELIQARRYEQALLEIQAHAQEQGGNAELLYLAARANAGLGRLELARKATDRMREVNPRLPSSLVNEILDEWRQAFSVNDLAYQQTLQEWLGKTP